MCQHFKVFFDGILEDGHRDVNLSFCFVADYFYELFPFFEGHRAGFDSAQDAAQFVGNQVVDIPPDTFLVQS